MVLFLVGLDHNNLVQYVAENHGDIFFWFGEILGYGAEFPVTLNNRVGFTSRLLYSSTPDSQKVFPTENCSSSRCLTLVIVRDLVFPS